MNTIVSIANLDEKHFSDCTSPFIVNFHSNAATDIESVNPPASRGDVFFCFSSRVKNFIF
jgi:hypothetical protein